MNHSERDAKANELRAIWIAAGSPAAATDPSQPPTPTPEEILMEVKKRSAKFSRTLFWRDLREVLAGVFLAVVAVATSIPAPGIWPKIGAAVLIASVGTVLWILRRSHAGDAAPPADAPLAAQVRREIERVRRQEQLLRSVGRWYMMPLALGSTVWMLCFLPASELPFGALLGIAVALVAFSLALFGAVGWAVVRLNRRAVEVELAPYRRELEQTLAEFG